MSKQRAYQLRRAAEGRCVVCGRLRENHTLRCDAHREQKRRSDAARWARRKGAANA